MAHPAGARQGDGEPAAQPAAYALRVKFGRADDAAGLGAMLPQIRKGVLEAAERRLRFESPGLLATYHAAIILGVLFLVAAALSVTGFAPLLAAAGLALWVAAGVLRHSIRKARERLAQQVLSDPRRCLACNYPLAALTGHVCPECGTPFGGGDDFPAPPASRYTRPTMADLHLLSPAGFAAAGVSAGLKRSGKTDLGLLVATGDRPAVAVAAFSRNRVVSPTITVGREHLQGAALRAVVVNSGNANACTGPRGERDARDACRAAADLLGCGERDVLPSSTGIIGRHLDMPKLLAGIGAAHAGLGTDAEHAAAFGRAILTTDLVPKSAATTFTLNGTAVTLAGVTKGSGMIGPMLGVDGEPAGPQATMLAYVTTDADIPADLLRRALRPATERTFNRTTVDGHASTNDTCLVLASGASGATVDAASLPAFEAALTEVCDALAYQIAADGEGATKAVVVRVTGGRTEAEAAALARAVAESPLVKTAMHGNDPNWGRIVSMAGMAAARDDLGFDPDRCALDLCGTRVFERGEPVAFDAPTLSDKLKQKRVEIVLDAAAGGAAAHIYTCDLSREYITINADYHT